VWHLKGSKPPPSDEKFWAKPGVAARSLTMFPDRPEPGLVGRRVGTAQEVQ